MAIPHALGRLSQTGQRKQDHVPLPPFKSPERVANDTFSVRFDDGFETGPRIEIWDPGSTAAALGGGGGRGVGVGWGWGGRLS